LLEGAYYSNEYQNSVGVDKEYLKIPTGEPTGNPKDRQFELIKKSMYAKILKDEGYFSTIAPRIRIKVAENTFDLGEYLMGLQRAGELKANFGEVSGRMVYYPPCHLREQNIDRPYQELLNLLPGINLDPVNGNLYCCGMAGIMGFKRDFHETSVRLGNRLMTKIKELKPEKLVTDCLSCRLQFNQLLPYKVSHPIEILNQAYSNAKGRRNH
jgi:glycerol-3-phosphate dehydrogenase subunit C